MKLLTQSEFRNQLETAILNDFVIDINQANQANVNGLWDYRYRYFLKAINSNEILPASVELQDIFYDSDENYKRNITPESYCKFVFKEDNCFTLRVKDNYIHIKSNTTNILDYDWTIISVESENELNIKNMNFNKKREIIYYIKNYEDLYLLDGRDAKQMMDILLF